VNAFPVILAFVGHK